MASRCNRMQVESRKLMVQRVNGGSSCNTPIRSLLLPLLLLLSLLYYYFYCYYCLLHRVTPLTSHLNSMQTESSQRVNGGSRRDLLTSPLPLFVTIMIYSIIVISTCVLNNHTRIIRTAASSILIMPLQNTLSSLHQHHSFNTHYGSSCQDSQ